MSPTSPQTARLSEKIACHFLKSDTACRPACAPGSLRAIRVSETSSPRSGPCFAVRESCWRICLRTSCRVSIGGVWSAGPRGGR